MSERPREFLVLERVECPRCDGRGRVDHHLMQRLREWPKSELRNFVRKYGASPATVIRNSDQPCPHCRGTGTVNTEIPLAEALDELAQHARSK